MRYLNETLGVVVDPIQYAGGVRYDSHGLGGVEIYVERLARAQRSAGVEASIVAARDPGGWNRYDVRREEIEGLPLATIGGALQSLVTAAKLLRGCPADDGRACGRTNPPSRPGPRVPDRSS